MAKHPAQFSDSIIDALRELIPQHIPAGYTIFDPFAGPGIKLATLCDELGYTFAGRDIEQWDDADKRVKVADTTLASSYPKHGLWSVTTSPCLAHGERVLRDDLQWVPVEDVEVGNQLVAFDESPIATPDGQTERRCWQLAEVIHSKPQHAYCVDVYLTNGETIRCTENHPWLCEKFPNSVSTGSKWIQAKDLEGQVVHRQMNTWTKAQGYDKGWLAGMYDGEGTFNVGKQTSLVSIVQKPGAVLEQIKSSLDLCGYDWTAYNLPNDDCIIIHLNGGVVPVMETLGHLRPTRLLEKWTSMLPWGFMVTQEARRVRVGFVRRVGLQPIQGITTSTGTYIGEGYLHHNTYGNGLNDHFDAQDGSRRLTYRNSLGRALHPHNTGRYTGRNSKKGEREYWRLHEKAVVHWPDVVIVNVKDSIRAGKVYPLGAKWMLLLKKHGYVVEASKVGVDGWRYGENQEKRREFEWILVGKREGA